MKLLLDQGNSRTKWALLGADGYFVARGVLDREVSIDDALRRFVEAEGGHMVDAVAISSVASLDNRQKLCSAITQTMGVVPVVLESRESCAGLRNGYAEPFRLGVDRWLAMLGARSHGAGSWLVVDAGTAVTVDAVAAGGVHLGGYIVPGYQMQIAMLGAGTAGVGSVVPAGGSGWGNDTSGAVTRGVVLELAGFVERAFVELVGRGDDTCRVIVTGGDADLLAPLLRKPLIVDPDLLFRGMLVALSNSRPRN